MGSTAACPDHQGRQERYHQCTGCRHRQWGVVLWGPQGMVTSMQTTLVMVGILVVGTVVWTMVLWYYQCSCIGVWTLNAYLHDYGSGERVQVFAELS